MDKVQNFRESIRPILTLMLAGSFCSAILVSLAIVLKVMYVNDEIQIETIVALIGILAGPFSSIMTYHYMKSSKKDETS